MFQKSANFILFFFGQHLENGLFAIENLKRMRFSVIPRIVPAELIT